MYINKHTKQAALLQRESTNLAAPSDSQSMHRPHVGQLVGALHHTVVCLGRKWVLGSLTWLALIYLSHINPLV